MLSRRAFFGCLGSSIFLLPVRIFAQRELESGERENLERQDLTPTNTADAIVVTCMDFRFRGATEGLVRERFRVQNFDCVSIAGGAADLSLSQCREEGDVILAGIRLSVKKHHANRIILLSHENCGQVFKTGIKFRTDMEESDFHHKALQKARGRVQKVASCKKHQILLGYLRINGDNSITLEEVS